MKELSCDDVIDRVPALVVGDLDPQEIAAIEHHTATCEACAQEVGRGRALAHMLDRLAAQGPAAPPLGERVRAAVPSVAYDRVESPVGPLYIAVSARGLCRIAYGGSEAEMTSWAAARGLRPRPDAAAVRPYVGQLREYFAGERREFDLPVDLSLTPAFTRQVLEATARIPFGQLATYRDIARAIGKPGATRAVGNALGSNPVPIVVPCHRVVRSDGTIGGYTGGLAIKWRLLAIEGVTLPAT
ncbi:MAG: methylated-DNA--[protein]-cysteine S-methyltransferase [Sphaerobacter sp.]|nr:methylated-DNA--[protein]-cysteine S-methyltransferase [Sphaerobacter sp.]